MWDSSDLGIEPVSPALVGRLSTTEPPGKPVCFFFFLYANGSSQKSEIVTIPWYNHAPAAAAAKSLQSCPTLCNPIDGSPPGSAIPGILQARTLEWVVIFFSNAWKVKVKSLSCVQLFETPWTAADQAPLSTGVSRQEYWSGVPLPSPTTLLVTGKSEACKSECRA